MAQTLLWINLAFEARSGGPLFREDSTYSLFQLRPHPSTVQTLLLSLTVQILLLKL